MKKEREDIVKYGKKLITAGLTTGSGGNLSIINRRENLIAITPSGIDYFDLTPDQVVITDLSGKKVRGDLKPSSELSFHITAYENREDVNAVVHTHSHYATTFACLNMEIPAVHYLVAFAGKKVPVAPYATFGTQKLADNIKEPIKTHNAALLANHGLLAVGQDLASAFNTAEEIEFTARIYHQTLAIGKPVILPDDEMDVVIEKFKTYGKQDTEK